MSGGLKRASSNVGKFEGGLGKASAGLGRMSTGLARAGTRIAAGVGIGLAATAKAAIDWEDAFQGVVKTVDASDESLDALAANLRDMSTRMPTSAIDLAKIAEAAGQMGVGFDKATGKTNTATIAAFTEQVAMLAATTDVSAEDAAMALGQLTNVIGLSGDEFDNFAAALVDLGNKGSSTESQILEITRRSGGAAKLIGIAKEETLGWAAAAANLGLNQELAGTGLQRFFLQTQAIITKGGGNLNDLAKIAGKSTKDFRKAFKKDASGALEDLLTGLGKMPKDRRLKAVQDLFGKGTGLTRLIIGLSDSVKDNLTPALDDSAKAWFESKAAAEEFAKRNQTVQSAISRLKNGIIDAAVSIGEGFAPALGRSADKLAEFLRQDENRQALKDLGKDIGKALDGIDWNEVLTGAREFKDVLVVALDYAKRIFDVINALPTQVKAASLGFLALDKLSGGLLGSGAGQVVGGLGEALAKSLAASIPVFGKAFVQPVFVTNMGAGGLGGGVPGAAGGIAPAVGAMGAGATLATLGLAGILSTVGNQIGTGLTNFINDAIPSPGPVKEQVRNMIQIWFDNMLPNPGSIKRNIENLLGLGAPEKVHGSFGPKGTTGPLTGGPSSFSAAAARDPEFTKSIADSKMAIVDQVRMAGDTFDRATSASKAATVAALGTVGGQVTSGSTTISSAVAASGSAMVGAINSLPAPVVDVHVTNNISATDVTSAVVTHNRAGPNSSRNGGGGGSPSTGNWVP